MMSKTLSTILGRLPRQNARAWAWGFASTAGVFLLVSIVWLSASFGHGVLAVHADGEASANLDSTQSALDLARAGVDSNTDWQAQYPTGFEYRFDDGVPMMLVPAGCYEMGGDPRAFFWTGSRWQQGVPSGGRICFAAPFWIDKYEVTQEQFERLGGVAKRQVYFDGANRPRENLNWFEARDFCALRGEQSGAAVRLPTEAEWEYAARGVDGLQYPWGNEWEKANAVWHRGYDLATAEVGSLPAGASWVGALDMSGNMWEWMLTRYEQYPYPTDENGIPIDTTWIAADDDSTTRSLRGGSWNNSYEDELRAAYRLWNYPDYTNLAIGFRCVRLDQP